MAHIALPISWKTSLLAIIPGLLATLGLIRNDYSIWMAAGLVILAIYLAFAYWWNDRHLPGWSLLAGGMLAASTLWSVFLTKSYRL